MNKSLWRFANPQLFMSISAAALPWVAGLAVLCILGGLGWGFFFTPDDFRQGSTVKILFVHVPSAMMAINCWIMMVITSLVWLIRRHHVSALAAKAAAPVGATMTVIAFVTGSLWGMPAWGINMEQLWWLRDPRLASLLVLFLFYLGYIALWAAIEDPDTAADLTSVLCIVGSVFALLSRYAAYFFKQGLHQGSSFSMDSTQHVANVFAYPAWLSMAGFGLLFLSLVLIGTRTEIRARRMRALLARERAANA